MMDQFVDQLHAWIHQYPELAPLFVFLCIALSSVTFVVSLDLLILTAALIAAYFNSFTPFFLACFAGTFFCGQTDYWIGRLLGKNLYKFPRIARALPPEKLEQMQQLFQRYGAATFIVGRFIPFGFRLVMFIGAGLFRFNLRNFILADLAASFIWTSCFFTLFYYFGQHAQYIKEQVLYVALGIALVGLLFLTLRLIRRRYATAHSNTHLPDENPSSASLPDSEL